MRRNGFPGFANRFANEFKGSMVAVPALGISANLTPVT
jgi:hypothetical protein